MSTVLYRLGRFAARRPWLIVGSWFLLAAAVVVANSTIGRDFEDTFTVPGQDSDDALVLLEAAQLDAAGASAQLVIASVVPGEPITDDLAQIDQIRAEFAELDDVVAVADPQISADGTVALVRVQYPPSDEMTAVALHKGNVFWELSGWAPKYFPELLKKDIRGRLQDKVMFGSDYPSLPYERIMREWDELGYRPEIMEKVFHKNAEEFLGL